MSKEIFDRIQKLRTLIDKERYQYHVLDIEGISPEALDSLKKSFPYATMRQENLAHGYYSVIKCQLD